MKRLNVKLTLWLVGITLVLVVGVHFLHGYQIERNADFLRVQAEKAREAGNSREAIKQYNQYLKYRDDPEAYSALAELVVDVAQDAEATRPDRLRAYNILEEAIRRHPDLSDVRRRLIDYTMLMRRFSETLEHIKYLNDQGETDPELEIKAAQCYLANGEDEQAIAKLCEIVGFDQKLGEFKSQPAAGAKEVDAFKLLARYCAATRGRTAGGQSHGPIGGAESGLGEGPACASRLCERDIDNQGSRRGFDQGL